MTRVSSTICVLFISVAVGDSFSFGTMCARAQEPARPDPAVITAWEKAGAMFGWMEVDQLGGVSFWHAGSQAADTRGDFYPYENVPNRSAIPAFQYNFPLSGSISRLPPPDVPFGLIFQAGSTIADVRELTGLRNLRILTLSGTLRSGTLQELAVLEQLQALECEAAANDEDLKALAKVKQLKSLRLSRGHSQAEMTPGGLKELGKLEHLQSLQLGLYSP
jgi:hypothetical protein